MAEQPAKEEGIGAVSVRIPGPPIGKGRPRMTRAGVAYTPKATRTWEGIARSLAMDAMAGAAPMSGPVHLEITIRHPIPQSWPAWKRVAAAEGRIRPTGKPDWSNVCKAAEDALNGVCFHDDAQVVAVDVQKLYADGERHHPGVELLVCRVIGAQAAQHAKRTAEA